MVTDWQDWQACSVTCGSGTQKSIRTITRHGQFGGVACPKNLQQTQDCEVRKCPIHCAVSDYSDWAECSVSCGRGGNQKRTRSIVTYPKHGGNTCPGVTATRDCEAGPCPIHCKVSEWGAYSTCDKSCGGGAKKRARSVITHTKHGGYVCPTLVDEESCNDAACPEDCVLTGFSEWSACTVTCDGGSMVRNRFVYKAAAHGGKACEHLSEKAECNKVTCPLDCHVGSWGGWEGCDKSCGEGTKKRYRTLTLPQYGGKACPSNKSESSSCELRKCPVHCELSGWSTYEACSVSCGGSKQSRARSIIVHAQHGGSACGTTAEERPCNTASCPIDCKLSWFSEWTSCTKTCGTGFQTRSRSVATYPNHGGKKCEALTDQRWCKTEPCPVDCEDAGWSKWSDCSKTCGSGTHDRTLTITREPEFGGKACPSRYESRACKTHKCPVDCVVSTYTVWGACSKTCNAGTKARSRSIITNMKYGGEACPDLEHATDCNHGHCPIHCEVTAFDGWGACTKTCGSGYQRRERSVITQAKHGGYVCPDFTDTQPCNTEKCPIDCITSGWTEFTTCPKSCGGALQERRKSVITASKHGGKACGSIYEDQRCNTQACPIDCLHSYSAWTTCTKTCGTGTRYKLRQTERHAAFGGAVCPVWKVTENCNTDKCPVDCLTSDWSAWSDCTKSCNTGSQTRSRSISRNVAYGGVACPELEATQDCSTQKCPENCVIGTWGEWDACSVTCGDGKRERTRTLTPPKHGGLTCPSNKDSEACSPVVCPVHCTMSEWGDVGPCSVTCDGGVQTKTRSIVVAAAHGASKCPYTEEVIKCNEDKCPIHCETSEWDSYDTCTKTCGTGSKSRARSVITHAKHGGYVCPELTMSAACNDAACPVDCVVSSWASFGSCSASCNTGEKMRSRSVITMTAYGGKACDTLSNAAKCNTFSCPHNCELTGWSSWTSCSKTCGGGNQQRTRSVASSDKFGGKTCDKTFDSRACNAASCPRDCVVSEWGTWGYCSLTCGGGGKQTKTRSVITTALYGGKACPDLAESMPCNDGECPVHCDTSSWSAWGDCTKSCGTGSQERKRSVVTHAAHGGYTCPALVEPQVCNEQECPIDCTVGEWTAYSACTNTCGGTGTKTHTRRIGKPAAHGGKACPALTESASCNRVSCPIDCKLSKYSAWEDCTKSCGVGNQRRHRSVITHAKHGGTNCAQLSHNQGCNFQNCPVDCAVSTWEDWAECDVTCEYGRTLRTRSVTQVNKWGGVECPALRESKSCYSGPCPVHCKVSVWGAYGDCSKSCETGTHRRARSVITHSKHGGYTCPKLTEDAGCNEHKCPVDCLVNDWSSWSACSKTCGTGYQTRARSISRADQHGGKICPTLTGTQTCKTNLCPIDCELTAFNDWTSCSEKCGGGIRTRSRSITRPAAHGGKACAPRTSRLACNRHPCPVDCVQSWTGWSACGKSCGTGMQTRTFDVDTAAAHGGDECPTEMDRVCNTQSCPVDCKVSLWSGYGACTKSCGTGTKAKTRSVVVSPRFGGKTCAALAMGQECNEFECAKECVVSSWSAYGGCTKTCGTGFQTRSRSVVNPAAHGAPKCPTLSDSRKCKEQNCPVDCVVDGWTAFGACSKSCMHGDGGKKIRHRSVKIAAAYGGVACPTLTHTTDCNTHDCPIDCELSSWNSWASCSVTCGTGDHSRTRTITRHPAAGGKACNTLRETESCFDDHCPIHCTVSTFTDWSSCSKTCDAGTRTRSRNVLIHPAHGGYICPALHESESCEEVKCPIHCQLSTWAAWTTCTKTCGTGSQHKQRSVITYPKYGGNACKKTYEEQDCGETKCPIHCVHSTWTAFSACTKTCGNGSRTATRSIITPAAYGGNACKAISNTVDCNPEPCAVDCVVSGFTAYGACTVTCGGGRKTRTRSVITMADHGGVTCATLSSSADCKVQACPVDCVVSSWGSFETCTKTCGGGTMTRERTVNVNVAHGGVACPSLKDVRVCNEDACPIDCVVSGWSEYGACSKTCANGSHSRARSVVTTNAYGGVGCPKLSSSKTCDEGPCPIHCEVNAWTEWTSCTLSCGAGNQKRNRSIVTHAAHGGYTCPNIAEARTCNDSPCPVDCIVQSWTEWTSCSVSCGRGNQKRTRAITQDAAYGGVACPALSTGRHCNNQFCPIDCVVGSWTAWDTCDKSCGTGQQRRQRAINVDPAYGGVACPDLRANQNCNTHNCPVDCVMHEWGSWGDCSKSCGVGTQSRTRGIKVHTMHGGKPCETKNDAQDCNTQACPIDCKVSEYGGWTDCSLSCGTGTWTRARGITVHPKNGGKACPALTSTGNCNTQLCPVDCVYETWSKFGGCGKSCGGGVKTRTRSVASAAQYGGKNCAVFTNTDTCNNHECPVDCVVSEWADWADCSVTCATGKQHRTRTVVSREKYGGKTCKTLSDTQSCNRGPCPIHCEVSSWKSWTACTHSCGVKTGTKTRTRSVTTHAAHGGYTCPALMEEEYCNNHHCPKDCIVSSWGAWGICDKTCGNGKSIRSRKVVEPAMHGGACLSLTTSKACNTFECPANCEVSAWTDWSACSSRCEGHNGGLGISTRSRKIVKHAQHGGSCPDLVATKACNRHKCDCSHIWCEKVVHAQFKQVAIRVHHDKNEQFGQHHVCKMLGDQCRCKCHTGPFYWLKGFHNNANKGTKWHGFKYSEDDSSKGKYAKKNEDWTKPLQTGTRGQKTVFKNEGKKTSDYSTEEVKNNYYEKYDNEDTKKKRSAHFRTDTTHADYASA
jgi:hypothetical protein